MAVIPFPTALIAFGITPSTSVLFPSLSVSSPPNKNLPALVKADS